MKSLTKVLKELAAKSYEADQSEYGRGMYDTHTIALTLSELYESDVEKITKMYLDIYQDISSNSVFVLDEPRFKMLKTNLSVTPLVSNEGTPSQAYAEELYKRMTSCFGHPNFWPKDRNNEDDINAELAKYLVDYLIKRDLPITSVWTEFVAIQIDNTTINE